MDESFDRHSEIEPPKKSGWKSEVIVAISAIVVSIMTLFVYIYQARIMMEQQHTSVWPHLEWVTNSTSTDTEQEFYLAVTNKGVGPALVKSITMTLDGKPYNSNSYKDLVGDLLGDSTRNSLWIIYSYVDNRVLAPGDEVKLIHIKNWKEARIPEFNLKRISYSLCYCSIYEDCWSTGDAELAGNCE